MAFRSSSSRSFSSSRSSSRPAATKKYQRPQTKTVIINRNIPAAQSGQAQSLGGSLAQGAAQGAGAGVGFGIANNLMGGNHSAPQVVTQPVYIPAPSQQYPQEAPQAPATYTEQPSGAYPQYQMQVSPQESGSGFGTFLVICLIGAVGYMGWKLYGARVKAEIAKRGY